MASNLTRFDPFNEIARIKPLRGIEDFFRDFSLMPGLRDFETEPRIRIEVTENEQNYLVKAEIPGVKKDDIKVDVDHNQVSISAETKRETEEKEGRTVVRSERYYGQQYRSFTLATDIDDEKVEAKYNDGILELSLPKKVASRARKVIVN
ncbi:HSP20 family protein [Actimicrobium sp. GrIS 1.19]|uniref:Hsp20/alpha crystallin family protein n=1 Tax=Actimicrobium sp. GrIS 1.19 TaxID=3071708 RepID=UPI002DFF003C|nr:HSP20 family protein [Actimicrobium sp. GrIS 1.19]